MKQFGILLLTAFMAILGGCGGTSSTSGNVNGNWTASLTDSKNSQVFSFTTSFTQQSGSDVSVTNLMFSTKSPCFVSGGTETGSFSISGDFNGNVTGAFGLTISSGTPSGNTLTLQGTVKNNVISGTWSLSGVTAGCTGNGNFTMNRS